MSALVTPLIKLAKAPGTKFKIDTIKEQTEITLKSYIAYEDVTVSPIFSFHFLNQKQVKN